MSIGSGDFWNRDFLMYECTTGHPPLSFCIIMTVVTYSTFSWTGGNEWVWDSGGIVGGAQEAAEVRMNGGRVRKGGDTQVA